MPKKVFISTIVLAHIIFIFLHIHKHSNLIKLLYQKQKYEKIKNDLLERKRHIQQEIYKTHDLVALKAFALNTLGMSKVTLNQLKALPHES